MRPSLRWARSNLNSHKTAPPTRCRLSVNLLLAVPRTYVSSFQVVHDTIATETDLALNELSNLAVAARTEAADDDDG